MTTAPTDEYAVEFVRAFLETRYGEFEQYVETSDRMAEVETLLPAGFQFTGSGLPLNPGVSTHWIDGAAVKRTTVSRLTESDDADPEEVAAGLENRSGYADASARKEGSLLVTEATVTDYGFE